MKRSVLILFILMVVFFSSSIMALASTILRMSFDQIVNGAQLIIDGTVLSGETRLSPISGKPYTYFEIEIVDVIKGDYPDATIEIGYMGGQMGELTLKVSDMRMPAVGERGVYFIERPRHPQIHPLIGWQQGHYRVIIDSQTGREVVVSDEDKAETPSRALLLQQGTALEDFKQGIRNIMEEGK